jgi:lysophospholipase L1-like esterase
MLGTNDLKARFSLTALDISFGVERLVHVILQSGCGKGGHAPAILLAAPPPVLPQGDLAEMFLGAREKSMQLAGHYVAVAQRCNCAFLDVSQVISVDPADGIHYSPQAHNELGNAMAYCVHSILSKNRGTL